MFRLDPDSAYRYFFPFSIAGALLGLGQFIFKYDGVGILWHREIMITLFLLPAAAGFLYTASPRFLKSKPAGKTEILLAMLAFLLLFVSYFSGSLTAFLLLKTVTLLLMLSFFMFRWWNRGANNAYWPPFILTSLVTGLFASLIQVAGSSVPSSLITLAGHLYYDAMFWILLFGIGLKFFPMLTGAVAPVYRQGRFTLISRDSYEGQGIWFAVAILAAASFVIQELLHPTIGLSLRAILVSFMTYQGWALFEAPQRKGFTTNILRAFLMLIVLSHFIFIFFPEQLVHLYHIVFVLGFLSLTLAVETRVVLSHERLDLEHEQTSAWQLSAYLLFFMAMAARVIAGFVPAHYPFLLHIASVLAVAGLVIMVCKIGLMLKNGRRA